MYRIILLLFLLVASNGYAQKHDSLTVLSWNVFLRPAIMSDGQRDRADSIGNYLLNSNADVLVLQELFHKRSRRRIIRQLKSIYPYHTKMGRRSWVGVPSGVCIFSKDSIRSESAVNYRKATDWDRMAKKGAKSIEISHNGELFSILGTHLQAGGGEKKINIRKEQLKQLEMLAEENDDSTITTIIAGDFNIRQSADNYTFALNCLNAMNHIPTGELQTTANFTDHLLTSPSGNSKWIDFILLERETDVSVRSSHIEEPRCNLEEKNERISDHNPIITVFEW